MKFLSLRTLRTLRETSSSLRTLREIFFPGLLLLIASGCGFYSFSGALPAHIKTCAVPLFANETVEPGIVEEITDQVIQSIIQDGSMKVVGEFQADAVVQGTITDVVDEAEAYTESASAKLFRIRIYAHVTFFDRRQNRAMWDDPAMEGEAEYDPSNLSAREEAIRQATQLLAKEIIDRTVAGW